MTETTETFDQLWQRLLDEETATQIVSRIQFWIDEKLFSDAVTEDAKLILTALTSKIEENQENALALARAARQALRQIIDESTRKYCEEARMTWEPGRRELADWIAGGKVGVKPAWAYPMAAELGGSGKHTQVEVDSEEI